MKQHRSFSSKAPFSYICGLHARFGKEYCTSHHINYTDLEGIILKDICRQIDFVINNETAREQFFIRKRREKTVWGNVDTKKKAIEKQISDLSKLIQKVCEDRVLDNMTEKVCAELLENYQLKKCKCMDKNTTHKIHIYYKLIDKPLKNKNNAFAEQSGHSKK